MNMRNLVLPIFLALVSGLILAGRPAIQTHEQKNPLEVLLLLPVPQPDTFSGDQHAVDRLSSQLGKPVLEQLAQLQAEGKIQDFTLLPEYHAIQVTVTDPQSLKSLEALDGVAGLKEMSAEGLACAARGAEAVQAYSMMGATLLTTPELSFRVPTTNPSIFVYDYPYGYYGYIYGYTNLNETVTMSLKTSAGTLKASATTISSEEDGYYVFYPSYQDCVDYTWYPEAGDIVEVTANGNTVSMLVAPISAFADPMTDIVTGSTFPNYSVEVSTDPTNMDCDFNPQLTSSGSNEMGNFSLNILTGFDRSVSVRVDVLDTNGNSTYTYTYPPRISIDYDDELYGFLKPNVSYTAKLLRANTTLETLNGMTDQAGRYSGEFSTPMEAGDLIQVSGGGLLLELDYFKAANMDFDVANDIITGNAGTLAAGRKLRAYVYEAENSSCTFVNGCISETVGWDGNFSYNFATTGWNLHPGQDFGHLIFDEEGNFQEFRGTWEVPNIQVSPDQHRVGGYWSEPGVMITVTLRDSGGVYKDQDTDDTSTTSGSYNAYFFGTDIVPGDKIEVTDGIHTLNMASVANLTANLDASSDILSGMASNGGTILIELQHYYLDPVYGDDYDWYCSQGTVTSGNYSINIGSLVDAKARDETDIYYTDGDGYITVAYSHAFSVNAEKGGDTIKGFTPLPETDLVLELWRGGVIQTSITTTSETDLGDYLVSLAPYVISEGDLVRVTPQGSSSYNLNIPELTVVENPANNQVTGRGPANAPVLVFLDQPVTNDDWEKVITVEAQGDYVATFNGVFESDCTPAQVGACTQPITTYYNEEGHGVYILGPEPLPVTADPFEADDTYTTATPYTGIQAHTFHATDDIDWISFTVAPGDVGKPLFLTTRNLGFNARTDLFLYDTDGTTLIVSEISYSPIYSEIIWVPDSEGVYYVRVEPYYNFNTIDCGSTYDFMIDNARIYLPLAVRQ